MRHSFIFIMLTMTTFLNAQTLTDWHCHNVTEDSLIVRLAEIEVHPEYLEEYLAAAKTVGAESVAKEQGVICIFPTAVAKDPNKFRILEIYASPSAYQSHLQTPHFLAYKQGTLHMVKSLDLVDVKPMNAAGMWEIFKKIQ